MKASIDFTVSLLDVQRPAAVDEDMSAARPGIDTEVLPHQSLQAIKGLKACRRDHGQATRRSVANHPATVSPQAQDRAAAKRQFNQAAFSGAATSTKDVSCFDRQQRSQLPVMPCRRQTRPGCC